MNECFSTIRRPDVDNPPEIPLPVYLRSVGHYIRGSRSSEAFPGRTFHQIFWCVAGRGEVMIDGNACTLMPEDVFFFLPGDPHVTRTIEAPFEYRFVSFDGPCVEAFVLAYQFPRATFHAGKCPVNLFEEMGSLLREMSPYAWREMISLLCRLLACAGGPAGRSDSSYGRLAAAAAALCRERFKDPGLNVNTLADEMKVSRATLRRVFIREMAVPPSEYLIRLRIQNAISLIQESSVPLHRIASMSGFADPCYFSRVILKRYGSSPSVLRKQAERYF